MKLSDSGFRLITSFEELKLQSYQDQAGIWTIGYGTTSLNGAPVADLMIINEKTARALFYGDVGIALKTIRRFVTIELNQNQFDALVSFVYNIGSEGFSGSTLLSKINEKALITEDLFTRWNKYTDPATGQKTTSNGLTRRRVAEYALFKTPVGNNNVSV